MIYGKIFKMLALFCGHLPTSSLRVQAYRLLGYRFGRSCRVGFGTVISVEHFQCGDAVLIGAANRFIGPMRVEIGDRCIIGRKNYFTTGESAKYSQKNYLRTLRMGDDVLVHEQHIIDLYGKIEIGKGTWIAGFRSQFLTHGLSTADRDIEIGEHCYIGSGAYFLPGTVVQDSSIVGMGAVVTKKFKENNVIISGFPADVIRHRSEDDYHEFDVKTIV